MVSAPELVCVQVVMTAQTNQRVMSLSPVEFGVRRSRGAEPLPPAAPKRRAPKLLREHRWVGARRNGGLAGQNADV